MSNYIIALSFVFLLFFTGCKKDIKLPDQSLKQLFNKWEWIETNPGDGGPIVTSSDKEKVMIEFNRKGVYKKYIDDKLHEKTNFSISEESTNSTLSYRILFKNNFSVPIVTFSGDTLILLETCIDCGSSKYVKKI